MPSATAPPAISTTVLMFFRRIVRGYFRRHFSAVRASGVERFLAAGSGGGPLIVYANHVSWWDPMVQVLLAGELMPRRKHYAPMDAATLKRYGIFRKIGVFGLEMKTPRGAAQFLRTSIAVLEGGGVLWVTPQGRFADTRERPLEFKPGLAALASRLKGGCTVLPLAIEYAFWDERLPETLLHFGSAVMVNGATSNELEPKLKAALLTAMQDLQRLAVARDPHGFQVIRKGRVGTGGFYEFGQRVWARLRGRRYQAEHTAPVRKECG